MPHFKFQRSMSQNNKHVDKQKLTIVESTTSRLYSILENKVEQVVVQPCRLVTSENECNPPAKRTEVRMKDKLNAKPKLFDNPSFRKFIYTTLIATTIIVNLDYIQPRDSSKANSCFYHSF
ncbi:hypothetical protein EAY31_14365 [Vibrio anguillarum]|nr:hypothetical protein [Vibrio anguillarum]MBF4300986.1 hypothetical protein [Vibrio anguillarum]MBF4398972.1 hypothetical protein [Vibrio anguillarum]MBF4441465.1 hypothetical protein [Vibrio anguillarum]